MVAGAFVRFKSSTDFWIKAMTILDVHRLACLVVIGSPVCIMLEKDIPPPAVVLNVPVAGVADLMMVCPSVEFAVFKDTCRERVSRRGAY